MACFARQGYHATSMDDVVRQSGLSVGAIYSYFTSKEELFLSLCEFRTDQTLVHLNALFRSPGPMVDKFEQGIDYFFQQLSEDLVPLARVSVEFLSQASKSERVKERQERRCDTIRQFLRWLLTAALDDGTLRPDLDLDAAVELMMALNEGIVLMSVAGLRQVPLDRLKPAYMALLNTWLCTPDRQIFSRATPAPADAALASTQLLNGANPKGGS